MTPPVIVSGNEIFELVCAHPSGIKLRALARIVADTFGGSTIFYTCSRVGLDFDDLLVFLEAREKVRVVRGAVYPWECAAKAARKHRRRTVAH